MERATAAGAVLYRAQDRDEAALLVVGIFHRISDARSVVLSADLGDLRQSVADALVGAGAEILKSGSAEAISQAEMGVTGAAMAVAETGSIVVAGNDLQPRLATMLPPVHVALVDRDSLVPSLDDAARLLRSLALGEQGPAVRYASFVTGPSRTADVEKTLSTGVHGPKELHIILVGR